MKITLRSFAVPTLALSIAIGSSLCHQPHLDVEKYQGPSAMVGRGAVTMVATATASALLIHR